ncbi:hypothetical protein HYH03_007119 [Edaphochlamys debaryana]|uniref:Mediator of RNA polymerase II transcription subunit 25 n=1 Tax=Edaphochlamys debaryana TaxID=47281 RepID=A0A835Y2R4_9CHLO|nr:hypothetical protein HYH03_007119 [Edaphochlamys debaryana]|eukprot:KAG2494880.1 hypothetical protein HYH03_007119 [Edaphochlamys debaryana]
MATPAPCRRLVLLVDALHASAATALRAALSRFANLLALSSSAAEPPPDVGLALVVYKPSRFALRDFQAALTRLKGSEEWAQPDTRKLVLALRSLLALLAREPPPGGPSAPCVLAVAAHRFDVPPGGLLQRVLQEAARALVCVTFLAVNTEASLAVFRPPAAVEGGADASAANGAEGGGMGEDSAALEAAAAAAAAAFGAALSDMENADMETAVAEPTALERLCASWLQRLTLPLAPPLLELVLPAAAGGATGGPGRGPGPGPSPDTSPAGPTAAAATDGAGVGGADAGGGGGGGGGEAGGCGLVVRCRLASQVSRLAVRCAAAPLCLCHGLPTLPLDPRGPPPSHCAVEPEQLLPPGAAPRDPLTVAVGDWQPLRLSGRSLPPPEVADLQDDVTAAGRTAVRLTCDRVLPLDELDQGLLYGWPQVMMPYGDLEEGTHGDDCHGVAGGSGGGGDGALLGALAETLRSRGQALLAWARASLCEGPPGQAPPAPSSLRCWYLLMPGPGCFLLRQVACREQLLPLSAPTPAPLPPAAVAAATRALGQLPGGQQAPPPHAPAAPTAPTAATSANDKDTTAPDPDALALVLVGEVKGEEAAEGEAEAEAVGSSADAALHTADGAADGSMAEPSAANALSTALVASIGPGLGTVTAPVPALAPAPAPAPFSPLDLSCGCHELLAALLRDSVRLTARAPHAPHAQQQGQHGPQQHPADVGELAEQEGGGDATGDEGAGVGMAGPDEADGSGGGWGTGAAAPAASSGGAPVGLQWQQRGQPPWEPQQAGLAGTGTHRPGAAQPAQTSAASAMSPSSMQLQQQQHANPYDPHLPQHYQQQQQQQQRPGTAQSAPGARPGLVLSATKPPASGRGAGGGPLGPGGRPPLPLASLGPPQARPGEVLPTAQAGVGGATPGAASSGSGGPPGRPPLGTPAAQQRQPQPQRLQQQGPGPQQPEQQWQGQGQQGQGGRRSGLRLAPSRR